MRKSIAGIVLSAVLVLCAVPMSVFAEEDRRIAQDGQEFSFEATATVSEDDWSELAAQVVISYPVAIPLSLDDRAAYKGSGNVYIYGVLKDNNVLTVSINQTDTENYRVVKYRSVEDGNTTYTTIDPKYYSYCKCDIGEKTSFSREEGAENLAAKRKMQDIPHNVVISAEINALIPVMGAGEYMMNIPLRISIAPAE